MQGTTTLSFIISFYKFSVSNLCIL